MWQENEKILPQSRGWKCTETAVRRLLIRSLPITKGELVVRSKKLATAILKNRWN